MRLTARMPTASYKSLGINPFFWVSISILDEVDLARTQCRPTFFKWLASFLVKDAFGSANCKLQLLAKSETVTTLCEQIGASRMLIETTRRNE